ncbi:hypothetical protein PFHG_04477 [Plasmodium falciparum HB3]|uniref:Uncharacterized protein n=1 Tax=Plasmodium falciparum (isolate HB3) TaxID=137071 RepID=A0A0L7KL60_PLAFX|nr:hypothetical protein PFHG_04477 [Plasmodium falciparum HB3]
MIIWKIYTIFDDIKNNYHEIYDHHLIDNEDNYMHPKRNVFRESINKKLNEKQILISNIWNI